MNPIFMFFKCLNSFFLVLIFNALTTPLKAQYASYGSGIGLNILRSDDNVDNIINARTTTDKNRIIGKPRLSLNIDYNFPREISSKWLRKIYNPVFANPYWQLRGQIIFNQFNIATEKNNSMASLGMSFLYFPKAIDDAKKTNVFIEAGYKMGWNNTVIDPFNNVVLGIGTRHRLGNDWYWQTNLTYTFAFYDYLDNTGPKGYAKTSTDGFFLLNFSLLKPFLTNKEQKRMEQSRDSLAVAENFAETATLKSKKAMDLIKSLHVQLKSVEDKVLENEKSALKLGETATLLTMKTLQGYERLKHNNEQYYVEREMDSLQSIGFSINLAHSVAFEKVNFELVSKNELDQKIKDLQQDIKEARQNLLFANKFLPRSKDFTFKIKALEAQELGWARESVEKALKETNLIQARVDRNTLKIKALVTTCEKTDKNIKNAIEALEKINAAIDKMKKN